MPIHKRLRQIIDEKKISISKFERTIGAGQNSISTCLRRESSVSHEVLCGIAKHFPEYSIDWLVTGKESNNKEIISQMKVKILELEQELNKIK